MAFGALAQRLSLRVGLAMIALGLVAVACGGASEPTATVTTKPQVTSPTVGQGSATASPSAQPTARPTAAPTLAPTSTPVPVPTGQLRLARTSLQEQGLLPGVPVTFMLEPIYDYLVGATPDAKLSADSGFASSWEMSPDGQTWTFKFRSNVRFTNGVVATAADAAYSMQFMTRSPGSAGGAEVFRREVKSLDVKDESTLVANLTFRDLSFPENYMANFSGQWGPLVSKTYVEAQGLTVANKSPIGSGPYKLKENIIGDRIVYEAVDNHWYWGVPRHKTLQILGVPELSTRLALLQSGGLEASEISRASAAGLRSKGFPVVSKKGATGIFLRPHQQWESGNPLGDVRVRQALSISIDRQGIVDTFLAGVGQPTINYIPSPSSPGFERLPVPAFDRARARQLLKEAGREGFELDVIIHERAGLPESQEMMEAIAVGWEAIGVKVRRVPMAYATALENLMNQGFKRPTVSGAASFGDRAVFDRIGLNVDPQSTSRVAVNEELTQLAKAYASAATLADKIRIGKEFARKHQAEQAISFAIAETSDAYATIKGIGGERWNLGAAPSAINVVQLATGKGLGA